MAYDVSKHNAERVIALPDEEIALCYSAGATIAELAAVHGVSRPTIAKALDRQQVDRRRAAKRPGVGSGEANPAWKGGRRLRSDGYIAIWTPTGEVLEHRKVMSDELGRPLEVGEIVHHRDGNKANNDPHNLEVMTQAEHAKHHSPEMHQARYGND